MGKLSNSDDKEAAYKAAVSIMDFPWREAERPSTWSAIYNALEDLSTGVDVDINERLQRISVCAKSAEAVYGARIITRSGQYYRALGKGITSDVSEAYIYPLEDAVQHVANKHLRLEVVKGGEARNGSELEQLQDRLTVLENG